MDGYKEIQNAYREQKLIPFVGSGFSKPLGLPDWGDLVSKTAEAVGYEPDLFAIQGNYPQLLEFLKIEHDKEWKRFLLEMKVGFDSKESDVNRLKSSTHKALAALNFKTIYTTNYDKHIEKALQDIGKKCETFYSLKDFARTRLDVETCQIIKFHGTLEEDESMILTESQYFDRMSLESAVDQRLRSDLLSNSFLFVGYSFSDTNIRYIWYKIHELKRKELQQEKSTAINFLRKSYYLTFGNEPIQSKLLKEWDIDVITLDPVDMNKSLTEFLLKLGQNGK